MYIVYLCILRKEHHVYMTMVVLMTAAMVHAIWMCICGSVLWGRLGYVKLAYFQCQKIQTDRETEVMYCYLGVVYLGDRKREEREIGGGGNSLVNALSSRRQK